MPDRNKSNPYKKFVLFLVGSFVLVLGITLVLVWWEDVLSFFRGFLGIVLAIAGLIFLHSLKD